MAYDWTENASTRTWKNARRKFEQIAQCLGWEWKLVVSGDSDNDCYKHYELVGPEDTILHLYLEVNGKAKLNVSTTIHRGRHTMSNYLPNNMEPPSCTCSWERAASDIARDIRRRVVPGALAYTKAGLQAIAEHKAKRDAHWARLDRIAEVLGGSVWNGHNGTREENDPGIAQVSRGRYGDTLHTKINYCQYSDEHTFNITIRCDHALAEDLCQWLAERSGKEG
jgi:hypothetical protein